MQPPPHSSYPAQLDRLRHILEAADRALLTEGTPADRFLAKGFRQHRNLGSNTRRLISDTLFSLCRWRGWLIPSGQPLDTLSTEDQIRTLILAQTLDSDSIHPLLEWGETLLPTPIPDRMGLGARTLAEKAQQIARWKNVRDAHPLSLNALVPAWFADQLAIPTDPDSTAFVEKCIHSFQQRPPTWLRHPTSTPLDAWKGLQELGYEIHPHARHPEAAACDRAISRAHLQSAQGSSFEIQDLASQCVGWIAAPRPGQQWWDTCAGSGGKSLHLASLMHDSGRIWATDWRPAILHKARQRWSQIASSGVELRTQALDAIADAPALAFDGVLVDAPCSGIGTWSRSPDARWRMPLRQIRILAETQAALLANAAQYVRPGGTLVYAVCTMSRVETLAIAETFTAGHPMFVPAPFPHPLCGELCHGIAWIWPWTGPCGAMFIAKWVRRNE